MELNHNYFTVKLYSHKYFSLAVIIILNLSLKTSRSVNRFIPNLIRFNSKKLYNKCRFNVY